MQTVLLLFILIIMLIFGYFLRGKEAGKFCFADIAVSIIGALTVSLGFDTSPLYRGNTELDSSIFIYIATQMHEGKVPYRDLFDHKGPALYFVEYLGAFGGTIGIWVLLTLSLASTILLMIFTIRIINNRLITQYAGLYGLLFPANCL